MKKRRIALVLAVCLGSSLVQANTDYNAGSQFAAGLKGQGTDTMNSTNPNDIIPDYNSNPPESGHYGGVTSGAATGLENAGMQSMVNTEAGKTTTEVVKQRPPDRLDLDAPFIKGGMDMRDKAETEAGQVAVPCEDVKLDKTEITTHQCDRVPAASLACTRTAKITWEEVDDWVDGEMTVLHPQIRYEEVHPKLNFYFSLPEDVYVSQYTLYSISRHCPGEKSGIAPANHDVQLLGEVFQPIFKNACPSPTEIGTGVTVNTKNVFVKKGEEIHGQYLNLWIAVPKGDFERKFNQGMLQHTVKLKVRKRGKVPAPKIEWVEHCPFDKSEEVKIESQCTEKGGTKTVTVDGKKYDIYSECWQYTDYYVKQAADNGSCQEHMSNPACTIVKTTCTDAVGSTCVREQAVFSCEKGLSGTGKMCGVELICASGECDQIKNDKADSFQKAVSALAAVAAAGEDVAELNDVNVTAFTGQRQTCRKATAGFSDCCKNGGWGNDVGLAHCDSEEKALGKAKQRKLSVYVGSYCSNKVLGVCLQKKEAYCVFDSKLAKIVQEQGRGWQLGIGFGSAKHSDCRGITIDELQAIEFDRLNFADFYADLEAGTDIPADQELIDRVQEQIGNSLQGQGGH
ncbi:conjugal transfer protein TraN [Providencia sp. PROV120]|uniref:conjugal transfer protein TraN n=1 Tax=Providencia sp. PROV120 TaxID=2949831 RepID=UPI00234A4ADE|nr:conjugal transfer protein TraN [Providencia sp. PROV120]